MKLHSQQLIGSATAALFALLAYGSAPAAFATAEPAPALSRLGMNLNGPADWNTEYPFVDVFRLSRQWISQKTGAGWGKGPALSQHYKGRTVYDSCSAGVRESNDSCRV
jgi:hypothetical protein